MTEPLHHVDNARSICDALCGNAAQRITNVGLSLLVSRAFRRALLHLNCMRLFRATRGTTAHKTVKSTMLLQAK
jgi:hypothetical protein